MREHRIIEKMVANLRKELISITIGTIDINFIEMAVDFLHNYADEKHHGKEENILFKDLAKKNMSKELITIMGELVTEHDIARTHMNTLRKSTEMYVKGDGDKLASIESSIRQLVQLYPIHIEKEDKRFFYPVMDYLSAREQHDMIMEFIDFDKKIILPKYEGLTDKVEVISKGLGLMQCTVCGHVYDPFKGDPEHSVKPNTRWEDLPENWFCPICNAPKTLFVGYKER